LAESLEWPEERWYLVVGSVLTGKAQEVYNTLPLCDVKIYATLKKEISKKYPLSPEAYRQTFRSCRKAERETYSEFAAILLSSFDSWCLSIGVDDFEQLKKAMVLEQFENSVSQELKICLGEREIDDVDKAAGMADNYQLSHKSNETKKDKWYDKTKGPHRKETVDGSGKPSQEERKGPSDGSRSPGRKGIQCYRCLKVGHIARDCKAERSQEGQGRIAFVRSRGVAPNHSLGQMKGGQRGEIEASYKWVRL